MIESIGVPVPGETALIAAALYAGSTHKLEIEWVIVAAIAGAIIGDNIGFSIGRYGGAKVLLRYGHKVRLARGPAARSGSGSSAATAARSCSGAGSSRSSVRTRRSSPARTGCRGRASSSSTPPAAIVWATVFGVAYYVFGDVLERLSTTIDIGARRRSAAALVVALRRLDEAQGGRAARARRARDRRLGRRGAR